MKVMILAAGRGKRMQSLTDNCPKPLLHVGQYSLIEWQIMRLARDGFREIVINLAYLGEQIQQTLGSGKQYGVNIQYSLEPENGLETAGGIIHALPLLGEKPFLVVNADVWCEADYAHFASHYRTEMLAYLMLVATPDWKAQGDFDLVGESVVKGNTLTFSGVSVLHPNLFIDSETGVLPLAPFLHRAAQQGKLYGETFDGIWQDVGTPDRLNYIRHMLVK